MFIKQKKEYDDVAELYITWQHLIKHKKGLTWPYLAPLAYLKPESVPLN